MNTKTAPDFVKEAKANIENHSPQQVHEELSTGKATLIDIRESEELVANGSIAGSTHAPRGMLEFYADKTLQYHKPEFISDNRIILHCASGGRSALAAATLSKWVMSM